MSGEKFSSWTDCVPYEVGDKFTMSVPVLTWWNRFLYWLINRPIPMEEATFEIVDVVSGSHLIIEDNQDG